MFGEDVEPEPTKLERANFFDGTLPSWLRTTGDGTDDFSDATSRGGYGQVSTGTASVGDEMYFATDYSFRPASYPVLSLRGLMETSSSSSSEMEMDVGFTNGNDYAVLYRGNSDEIEIRDAGQSTFVDTVPSNHGRRHPIKVDWYTSRGVVEVFSGGTLVGKVESGLPTPDRGDYYPRIGAVTNDTSADRHVFLYGLEVGYKFDNLERTEM